MFVVIVKFVRYFVKRPFRVIVCCIIRFTEIGHVRMFIL